MFNLVSALLRECGIELAGKISLEECKIIKPYLLERHGISSGTAIVIAAPYYADDNDSNISKYAVSKDYHIFYKELFERIIPKLQEAYPDNKFAGFADHSPIDEIEVAAKCGLGVIGKHGLLITEKYSSFVFIATLFTDALIECETHEIKRCESCGLCKKACPVLLDKSECLSARTQKKGELSESDIELMKKHGTVWGCDICQSVCPHTKKAIKCGSIYSPIPFFNEARTPLLTYDIIEKMSEEEFRCRAYSWRGRDVILRNLNATQEK